MANMSQSLIQPSVPIEEPLGDAPIRSSAMSVESAWIDYNGHLNMAYYHVLFDRALDQVFACIGVDKRYVEEAHHSIFALEAHVCYLRELRAGERVAVETVFLGHDAKRLHLFQSLLNLDKGFVAATSEQVGMHVDLGKRRGAPFPAAILARIGGLAVAHARLPQPDQAGRRISLAKEAR
jgi:acyl-CoA thioester hydrolase